MKKASSLVFSMDGRCNPASVVRVGHCRFTLLTDRILRLEYDPEEQFEDRPSQTVLNRNFPAPEYSVRDQNGRLEIDTPLYHLSFEYGVCPKFTENSLKIDVKNGYTNYGGSWRFGSRTYGDPPKHDNLMGTARTLDRTNGAADVDWGLMDRAGRSWFDDSNTALLGDDGGLYSRRPGTVDVYYVCCGHAYNETLAQFYRITGAPPMLPRYALGNWWSRWFAYSEDSYNRLMDGFKASDIPFSVAVLDMDWHLTEVAPKYGKGWTGYTWNTKLFPEPRRFLKGLHDRGLHVTLNLHPADGVQGCEDAYEKVADIMGVDKTREEAVLFDFTDPKFVDAYFEYLIHPYEEMGVDFWWIDWQQGRSSKKANLDPLWLLNHYHYLDNCRSGKRGMLLSRYAELGSHRYPAGFSGDTHATWESLDFQAWFTLTATNAGFPWWSHDIGGFMQGIRDPELFIRWLQLGVFSPFLRLHSTKRIFNTKEPASFGKAAPDIIHWLQLRHRLIPYIYTEMHRQHTELVAMIRPLYYQHPDQNEAYTMKNQYYFGDGLMVCPITTPAEAGTEMGSVQAWLPEGVYTDLFTGKTYTGGRKLKLHRRVEEYPVLAKPGAIIPLAAHIPGQNHTGNPKELEIMVFPQVSGNYTLFEDDGITDNGPSHETRFDLDVEKKRLTIAARGDATMVPADRKMRITFRGVENFTPTGDLVESVVYDRETRSVTAELKAGVFDRAKLSLEGLCRETNSDRVERCKDFLMLVKMDAVLKESLFAAIAKNGDTGEILQALMAEGASLHLLECLTELLNQ